MRLPAHAQSRIVYPLNDLLGTPVNVRLIRALALAPTPLAAGELARRAALGRTSIYPALRGLEAIGIVEFAGAGAHRQVQLRERHPLARRLKDLFEAEARRFDDLTSALREIFLQSPVRPVSAWVQDAAPGADDDIGLYFVARPEEKEALSDYLTEALPRVERAQDVHANVTGLTRSELDAFSLSGTLGLHNPTLLDGVPPAALLQARAARSAGPRLASHGEHDARARRLALAIATKTRRDPGLIMLARQRLERRIHRATPKERRELMEWLRNLSTMSPARLRAFLVENSERAARMRQSLPALGLLSPEERQAVLDSRTDAEAIAAVDGR